MVTCKRIAQRLTKREAVCSAEFQSNFRLPTKTPKDIKGYLKTFLFKHNIKRHGFNPKYARNLLILTRHLNAVQLRSRRIQTYKHVRCYTRPIPTVRINYARVKSSYVITHLSLKNTRATVCFICVCTLSRKTLETNEKFMN